jgi:hypothetical protein
MNLRSRSFQIRLWVLVGLVLGLLTLAEGLLRGRISLDSLGSKIAARGEPVETRLPAPTVATQDSLTMLTLPESPKPWQTAEAKENEKNQNPRDPVEADFWRRAYESLSVKQRDQLQASLRFAKRGEPSPLGTSDRAELLRNLKNFAESYHKQSERELSESKLLTPERQAAFRSEIEKTMSHWREDSLPTLTKVLGAERVGESDREAVAAIDARWRELSLGEVQDDEPSPSKDFVAWFGLFDEVKHDSAGLDGAPEVSYARLFDQASQLRGKPVRIRGVIRAAEYLEARPNLYGVKGYYVCWIRPDNYRDAPIKVFSLSLPKNLASGNTDLNALLDRECDLRGLFFKRTAYRAQDDIRTVPTVLCAEMSLVAVDPSVKKANDSIGLVMISLAVAAVGAVIFVIYLFSDRGRIRSLPNQVDFPTHVASEK